MTADKSNFDVCCIGYPLYTPWSGGMRNRLIGHDSDEHSSTDAEIGTESIGGKICIESNRICHGNGHASLSMI